MFFLPAEGNFCDKHGKFLRPAPVQNYNSHIKQVDKSTNLMAQLRPLTDNTQKRSFFPPSKIYHFKKCYHSCHLIFKIITLTIETDLGERSNTRQVERTLNSNHGQELNRFDTNTGLWKGQELGVVHVTHTHTHTHKV